MASASSIAHILLQKYFYAVPLARQEKEWLTLGVNLSRGTMANWVILAAKKPLLQAFCSWIETQKSNVLPKSKL